MTFAARLLASSECPDERFRIGAWCITLDDGFFRVTVFDPAPGGKRYVYVVQGDRLELESEQEAE